MLVRQRHDLERLLGVVHRHHQHAGLAGAGHAQKVEPGGVTIEDSVAEGARHFQNLDAVVEHRGGHALRQHHAGHDLSVAAKAGDKHGRILRL